MTPSFDAETLSQLAAEVDRQLQVVRSTTAEDVMRGEPVPRSPLEQVALQQQQEAIASYTQEPAEGFMRKFMRVARRDLCEEGGVLYQQWKKWGDLENKEAIERIGAVLVAMGISGNVLNPLVVAVTVVVIHLSVRTVCEEYGEKG